MVKKPKADLNDRLKADAKISLIKDFTSHAQPSTQELYDGTNNVHQSTHNVQDSTQQVQQASQDKINKLKNITSSPQDVEIIKLQIGSFCLQETIPVEKRKTMKRGAYNLRLEVIEKIELLANAAGITKADVVDLLLNKALNDVINQLD